MKVLNKIYCMIALTICITICGNIYGATTISTSTSSPKVGDTITVSIKVSSVATWQLNVSYDSSKLQLTSGSTSIDREDNGIDNVSVTARTLTFKTIAAGTANISVSGNSYNAEEVSVPAGASTNITITVPAPVVTTPPETTTPPAATTTSSNAYLKKLSISVEGLNPAFSKTKTAYSVSVKENVTSIDVSAVPEDGKATYYVSGNKNLVVGENIISITVTAPDKSTKKTYKISVVKSNNPELADASLKSLIVEGLNLGMSFDPNITEYNCADVDATLEKLNILAYPTNEKAKIEIIGNDSLKVGANVVIIKVTSESGAVTKEYFLKFNKKEATVVTSAVNVYTELNSLKTNDPSKFEKLTHSIWLYLKRFWLDISLVAICLLEFGQILYLYSKIRKMKEINKPVVEENIDAIVTKRRNNLVEQVNTEENTSTNEEKEVLSEEATDDLIEDSQEYNIVAEEKSIDEDNNEE